MCLAKVYNHKEETDILVADTIANIFFEEKNRIRMLDIFGEETIVEGTLLDMDLARNIVRIVLAQ